MQLSMILPLIKLMIFMKLLIKRIKLFMSGKKRMFQQLQQYNSDIQNIKMLQQALSEQPFTQELPAAQPCRPPEPTNTTHIHRLHFKCEAFLSGNIISRSRSGRKLRKVKTPSEVLKESILKYRQSKKIADLKLITEQNFKLFCRLQEQRSAYQFQTLHRDHPSGSTQLSRASSASKLHLINCQQLGEGLKNRCASSLSLQKSNIKPPQLENAQHSSQTSGRASFKEELPTKTSLAASKNNKQNMGENEVRRSKVLGNQQEQLLARKLCLKIPLGGCKAELKRSLIQKGVDVELPLSFRPSTAYPESKKGFLTERRINLNL